MKIKPEMMNLFRANCSSWIALCFSIFSFFLLPSGPGTKLSIDWHHVARGGGTSSNSQYIVSGTISQHDAGGQLLAHWRFPGLAFRGQAPSAPTLYVNHSGNILRYLAESDGVNKRMQRHHESADGNCWLTFVYGAYGNS